jgi:NADP-dependent 3-hydroxy acid dehydrogenase YdfG
MEKLNLPNTVCTSVDVTDINSLKNAIWLTEERFGHVDCLINNAGFAKDGDFTEVTHDDVKFGENGSMY